MTNAQMDVLLQKLDAIEKRQIQFASVQNKQLELSTKIANDKIDVDSIKLELDNLNKVINSIRDEVEAWAIK